VRVHRRKAYFSNHPENPKDEVDYLMLYCFELASKIGTDFGLKPETFWSRSFLMRIGGGD
jgi:hypothetical protein